jgi:hypothetical protein
MKQNLKIGNTFLVFALVKAHMRLSSNGTGIEKTAAFCLTNTFGPSLWYGFCSCCNPCFDISALYTCPKVLTTAFIFTYQKRISRGINPRYLGV